VVSTSSTDDPKHAVVSTSSTDDRARPTISPCGG
jgi:hypothetical protein